MRVIFFALWCLAGFCFLISGCSASISADKLEARLDIKSLTQSNPQTVVYTYDKSINRGRAVDGSEPSAETSGKDMVH